jgi:HPt (histidine-containing phosphotransfer) domain-containing protein
MLPKPAETAVDLHHLDRYTGGDQAVNREILALFENQCHEMVARLGELVCTESADPIGWRHVTHALKGAARGVGAFGLANEAAQAETVGPGQRGAAEAFERVKAKSEAVYHFIDNFLKNEP